MIIFLSTLTLGDSSSTYSTTDANIILIRTFPLCQSPPLVNYDVSTATTALFLIGFFFGSWNLSIMISRPALLSRAARSLARSSSPAQRRFLASATTTTPWEKSEAVGVKTAGRDTHGPTTTVAIVAKAGTRYEPLPGLTTGLEEFAFKVGGHDGGLFGLGSASYSIEMLTWVSQIYRTRLVGQHCESRESLNCSVVSSMRFTRARLSCYQPAS